MTGPTSSDAGLRPAGVRSAAGVHRFDKKVGLIWSAAQLLRGSYKAHEYGSVILPLTVLRRLDQVLEPTRQDVVTRAKELREQGIENPDEVLKRVSREQIWNSSQWSLPLLVADADDLGTNLREYLAAFSPMGQAVLQHFDFERHISRLEKANLLYTVVGTFASVDLHPDTVSGIEMGYIFEELIRRFAEQSNETAGEHFTPREVIRLMVNLLLIEDEPALATPGTVRTIYDCACGTGGMLTEAQSHLREINADAVLKVFGQELNPESYAICLADMLVKGEDASHIVFGNSFTEDGHAGRRFDYLIANPPFGVEWKEIAEDLAWERDNLGYDGRFGAGLPSVTDGSLLFLQHMIDKMKPPEDGGSRMAIVFNGTPIFSGQAGGAESRIRQWFIEADLLEAVIGLPDQLFYNTGIGTYVLILSNRKPPERQGVVQLIDARESFARLPRGLGDKRKEITTSQIDEITRLYGDFAEGPRVQILPNEAFGHQRIQVERALRLRWTVSSADLADLGESAVLAKASDRDLITRAIERLEPMDTADRAEAERLAADALAAIEGAKVKKAVVNKLLEVIQRRDPTAPPIVNTKGVPKPDTLLRSRETVALDADIDAFLAEEVHPFYPDAWVDEKATKVGFEILFTQLFFTFPERRPTAEIRADLLDEEARVRAMLEEVVR